MYEEEIAIIGPSVNITTRSFPTTDLAPLFGASEGGMFGELTLLG